MRFVFDVETNGLLETLTTIHCLVCLNADTDEIYSFGPSDIPEGLKLLQSASELIGHNAIKFDLPAISKVYPSFTYDGLVTDTLVLTRLIYSDLKGDKQDGIRLATGQITKEVYGSHSLNAWGQRIGLHKMSYEG